MLADSSHWISKCAIQIFLLCLPSTEKTYPEGHEGTRRWLGSITEMLSSFSSVNLQSSDEREMHKSLITKQSRLKGVWSTGISKHWVREQEGAVSLVEAYQETLHREYAICRGTWKIKDILEIKKKKVIAHYWQRETSGEWLEWGWEVQKGTHRRIT